MLNNVTKYIDGNNVPSKNETQNNEKHDLSSLVYLSRGLTPPQIGQAEFAFSKKKSDLANNKIMNIFT